MKNLDYYMGFDYRAETVKDKDEEGYAAYIPALKGCITTGTTAEEALANLEDAKRCWLSCALENGDPIPEPGRKTVEAMREAERIANDPSVKGYDNLDELFSDLKK